MSLRLHLRASDWLDDWYVLEGGRNWAQVEGTPDEWREIAAGLEKGETFRFKRAAAFKGEACWELYSPRNRSSTDDCILVEFSEAAALAAHIRSVVGEKPPVGGGL